MLSTIGDPDLTTGAIVINNLISGTEMALDEAELLPQLASENENASYNSHIAECPQCTLYKDSTHIDQYNGEGTFNELKEEK